MYVCIYIIASPNFSTNLCPKFDILLQYWRVHLKNYQIIKAIRSKIKLSVITCFVSRFFKIKLKSGFCLKLSGHIKD